MMHLAHSLTTQFMLPVPERMPVQTVVKSENNEPLALKEASLVNFLQEHSAHKQLSELKQVASNFNCDVFRFLNSEASLGVKIATSIK